MKVFVADSHEIVIQGIRQLAEASSSFQVVGTACRKDEIITGLKNGKAKVLILDQGMLGFDLYDFSKKLSKHYPKLAVLIYTTTSSAAVIQSLCQIQLAGILLKSEPLARVLEAILAVARGERYLSPLASQLVASGNDHEAITLRELQVLQLLSQSHKNKKISSLMAVDVETVRFHKKNLKTKLGVKTSAGLILRAQQLGLNFS